MANLSSGFADPPSAGPIRHAPRMPAAISVEPLALHPQAIPVLRGWFEAEWPAYYGPGGPGSAQRDLEACANEASLPVGVVALLEGEVCGVAALKAESIPSHAHLSPWAAAGLVDPALRGRGIGRLLLAAVEQQARKLGFAQVYCGTSSAHGLLQRSGWELTETILHAGERLGIYGKALQPVQDDAKASAPMKSQRLLAVYARWSQAIAGIPDARAHDLHRLAGGVPKFVAQARVGDQKRTDVQVAAGLAQALRELPELLAEVDSQWRPAVSRALHQALAAECPEWLALQRRRLHGILLRGRISTRAEFHAVQYRIDVLEGEPELGEELRALYALVSADGGLGQ